MVSDLDNHHEANTIATPTRRHKAAVGSSGGHTGVVAISRICFARSGDVHLAHQVVGDGPIDLIYIPLAFEHLETYWEDPAVECFLRRLGSFSRLVIYDKGGTGMSDRLTGPPTMAERAEDALAIMQAIGSEHTAIFGMSEGGAIGGCSRRPTPTWRCSW